MRGREEAKHLRAGIADREGGFVSVAGGHLASLLAVWIQIRWKLLDFDVATQRLLDGGAPCPVLSQALGALDEPRLLNAHAYRLRHASDDITVRMETNIAQCRLHQADFERCLVI